MDTVDKGKHNIKLSTPTFDKFRVLKNVLTVRINQPKIENDIFLSMMLYFIEQNVEDFVVNYNEKLINEGYKNEKSIIHSK